MKPTDGKECAWKIGALEEPQDHIAWERKGKLLPLFKINLRSKRKNSIRKCTEEVISAVEQMADVEWNILGTKNMNSYRLWVIISKMIFMS